MTIRLRVQECPAGACLPLLPAAVPDWPACPGHRLEGLLLPPLAAGTRLFAAAPDSAGLFMVTGRVWLPAAHHAVPCPLLTALTALSAGTLELEARKEGYSLAWVTLSDKGSRGEREDTAGPAIAELVAEAMPLCHSQGFLLPDEPAQLRALLTELALGLNYDLICTTGGTGLSPRDQTPQVTERLLDVQLPGFVQAMMAASLAKTPHAVISRAAAGVLGESIVLNLPGSRRAVLENLAAVLPALPHALAKLQGDPADCAATAHS